MKVKDFIKMFENMDQDQEVIMSKDSEGNRFSPFCELGFLYYVPNDEFSGEAYEYDEKPDNVQEAVILFPMN